MSDAYRFRLIDLDDDREIERTAQLLRLLFTGSPYLTADYLRWQYRDNPDGRAVGCNAWLGDELVGTMTAVPMRGRVEGTTMRGLFMLNGAVHPMHQRRKLQSRISAAIFDECVRQGYRFCLGTGNRYSTIPLLTRFKLVRPLDARVGFGRPARRDPGFTPSFERLWSEQALRWRLANPERRYAVRTAGASLSVVAPTGMRGIGAILYDGPNEWDLETSGDAPPGPLRLWLGLDPGADWRRSAFLQIPQRLRPSPLNLVFKDLTGGALLPDPDRFVFRAIDFDPY